METISAHGTGTYGLLGNNLVDLYNHIRYFR